MIRILPAVLITAMLAACGATAPDGSSAPPSPTAVASEPPATSAEPEAAGTFVRILGVVDCPGGCPVVTVSDAIAEAPAPGEIMEVTGVLFVEPDGDAWFCDAITESSPPQCAGSRLAFEGQGVEELLGTGGGEQDGVRWTEPIPLLGEIHR
jgi:hypothetical protein